MSERLLCVLRPDGLSSTQPVLGPLRPSWASLTIWGALAAGGAVSPGPVGVSPGTSVSAQVPVLPPTQSRPTGPSGTGQRMRKEVLGSPRAGGPTVSLAVLGLGAVAPCSREHCCLFTCRIELANPRRNFVCAFNKIFLGKG